MSATLRNPAATSTLSDFGPIPHRARTERGAKAEEHVEPSAADRRRVIRRERRRRSAGDMHQGYGFAVATIEGQRLQRVGVQGEETAVETRVERVEHAVPLLCTRRWRRCHDQQRERRERSVRQRRDEPVNPPRRLTRIQHDADPERWACVDRPVFGRGRRAIERRSPLRE